MHYHTRPLIGCSDRMERLHEEVDQAARSHLPVMIRGERGTGKDLIAREIHRKSQRAGGPFVKVNCAAVPETLVETEFFGCEKGAFTGAEFRKGKFELADHGTIFLDELGEFSMTMQPKLLQVAETFAVDRVGGQRPIPVDFRLIAATNRNLEQMVQDGNFRDDLYDRLNIDVIWAPTLRERLEDIPLLVEYFIGDYVSRAQRPVTGASKQVLDLFRQYWWPGNIRELENVIARAVFKGKSELIRQEDLPSDFGKRMTAPPVALGNHDELCQAYSRQLFERALAHCDGDRSKAQKVLGLSRARFYRLLKLHGLNDRSDNGRDSGRNPHGSELIV